MKQPKTKWARVPWTPFAPGVMPEPTPRLLRNSVVYLNSRYQVYVTYYRDHPWGLMVELSIKTLDKQAHHDWRDFQRIKNELVGPEWEAVELYPAESRLVDTANQYYLWCFETFKFPFGFQERMVMDGGGGFRGSRQRPFDHASRPADCLTEAEWQVEAARRFPDVFVAEEEE